MSEYLGNMIDDKYTDGSLSARYARKCGYMQALLISMEISMDAYDDAECGDEALGAFVRALITNGKQEIEDKKASS